MKSALSIPFATALGTSATANDGQGDAPLLWLADEFYEVLALYDAAEGDAWDLALERVNEVAHRLLEAPTSSLVGYAAKARAVWWFSDMEMREAGIQFSDARDVLIVFFRDLEAALGAGPGVWAQRESLCGNSLTAVGQAIAKHREAMAAFGNSVNGADSMSPTYSLAGERRYERLSVAERAAFEHLLAVPAVTTAARRAKISYLDGYAARNKFDYLSASEVGVVLRSFLA